MTKDFDRYRNILIYLVLALTVFVIFYQVHSFNFINLDDPEYVYENPNIQSGITFETIKWAFSTTYSSYWHPLTWLSHALDWQLFGSNPAGHHYTNLIFHIVNTLLVFMVLKQMTRAVWPSVFVAALFGLHPLHVESVAWVSERKDVLSTLFWLLTMAAYVRYVRKPGIVRYVLVLLSFALGLMAKPMLVTLPCVLLLLDYWPLGRVSFGQAIGQTNGWNKTYEDGGLKRRRFYYLVWEKIPFFTLSVVSSIITFVAQQRVGAVTQFNELALRFRICNALISYVEYIWKMVWPTRLAFFYPHPGQDVSILYAAMSGVLLLTVTIFVLRFSKDHRYLLTGWFWYIGTFVPVIGVIQVGMQARADRYSYITLTGLFIIIAWGLPELLGKWRYRKALLWACSLAVLLVLGVCAHIQQRYWKDIITLCEHALKVTDDNYEAHFCMTETLCKQGRIEEAIRHNFEAVRIRPDYIRAINDLGISLYKAGRVDEAIYYYKKALEINPHLAATNFNLGFALATEGKFTEAVRYYRVALETMDTNRVRINLGLALMEIGRLEEAVGEYEKVLLTQPQHVTVHNNLGVALLRQGKFDEANKHFTEAIRIRPDFADAHVNLGNVLFLQGKFDEAILHLQKYRYSEIAHYYLGLIMVQKGDINQAVIHLQEALRLKPDWKLPMNDLAWLLATSDIAEVRNPQKAIELAQRACELSDYNEAELLDTLSAANAAAGNYSKAIEMADKAVKLCQSSGKEALEKEIQNRLVLYKAGKAYTESR